MLQDLGTQILKNKKTNKKQFTHSYTTKVPTLKLKL